VILVLSMIFGNSVWMPRRPIWSDLMVHLLGLGHHGQVADSIQSSTEEYVVNDSLSHWGEMLLSQVYGGLRRLHRKQLDMAHQVLRGWGRNYKPQVRVNLFNSIQGTTGEGSPTMWGIFKEPTAVLFGNRNSCEPLQSSGKLDASSESANLRRPFCRFYLASLHLSSTLDTQGLLLAAKGKRRQK
jgi:hypothetical protein